MIVGSGPASLAAALALIPLGIRPRVLCSGLRPDDSAIQRKDETSLRIRGNKVLKRADFEEEVKAGNHQRLGNKSWFGSSSAMEQIQPLVRYSPDTGGRISYGLGGFSKVWGATSRNYDFSSWDSRTRPTLVDFQAIGKVLPEITIGCEDDDFSALSPMSQRIFTKLKILSTNDQFKLEPSTVAINHKACILREKLPCALCLRGCPEDAIFSTDSIMMDLSERKLIILQTNVLVESIEEIPDGVRIEFLNRARVKETFFAKKLILAAGALGSPTILVKSKYFDELTVRDSATLFSVGLDPLMWGRRRENLSHGLSQWWLNRDYEEMGRGDSMFVQGYSPSTEHSTKILKLLKLPRFMKGVVDPLSLGLHPLIVYFDMHRSGSLKVRRSLDGVDIEVGKEPDHDFIRSSMKQLRYSLRKAGLIVPISLSQFGSVGEGHHSGASLPMLDHCDEFGRVKRLRNTYVVDSSCLQSIEAGPITKTVMINAHRISRLLGEKLKSENA